MYQTVNFSQFVDSFNGMGRGEQFSYEGLRALFDYLEELEEETLEEIELDVIGLCCEYTEYSSWQELQEEYPDIETLAELEGMTTVIILPHPSEGYIIRNF